MASKAEQFDTLWIILMFTQLLKPMTTLRIATRESQLALWQAYFIKAELERYHPDLTVEILGMHAL